MPEDTKLKFIDEYAIISQAEKGGISLWLDVDVTEKLNIVA